MTADTRVHPCVVYKYSVPAKKKLVRSPALEGTHPVGGSLLMSCSPRNTEHKTCVLVRRFWMASKGQDRGHENFAGCQSSLFKQFFFGHFTQRIWHFPSQILDQRGDTTSFPVTPQMRRNFWQGRHLRCRWHSVGCCDMLEENVKPSETMLLPSLLCCTPGQYSHQHPIQAACLGNWGLGPLPQRIQRNTNKYAWSALRPCAPIT